MDEAKKASLTVLGGPLAGARLELPDAGVVTLGSAPDCTLPLSAPGVHPLHARLVLQGGRAAVHAAGPDRPVHVNDDPIGTQSAALRNGDILWLGVPGGENVVMLQCVLATAPEQAAEEADRVIPTPEIETTALWATPPETGAPSPAAPPDTPASEDQSTVSLTAEEILASEEAAAFGAPSSADEDPLVLAFDAAQEDEAVVVGEPDLVSADETPGSADGSPETVVIQEEELFAPTAPTFVGTRDDLTPETSGAPPDEPPVVEPEPAEPVPFEPIPVEPMSAEPAPVEPVPAEPMPAEPMPAEPMPAEPMPAEPMPAEPMPAEPAPAEPAPAGPVLDGTEAPDVPLEAPADMPVAEVLDDAVPVAEPLPPSVPEASTEAPSQAPPPTPPAPDAPAAPPTPDGSAPTVAIPPPESKGPSTAGVPPEPGASTPPLGTPVTRPEQPPSASTPSAPPVVDASTPGAPATAKPPRPDASAPTLRRRGGPGASRPGTSQRGRRAARARPRVPPEEMIEEEGLEEGRGRSPVLLAAAGFAGVLVVAGLGWAIWRFALNPTPAPTPEPVAAATPVAPPVAPPRPQPTPEPGVPGPTAAQPLSTPQATPTPPPVPVAAVPEPTPTPPPAAEPAPTPTPAPPRATPATAQPSAAELRAQQAQQTAERVGTLLDQADAALDAGQHEEALTHLNEALSLDPQNTRGRTAQARAIALRDLARRRFVPTRTRVQTEKEQEGGLAGFDLGDADLRKAPDFQGRIEFEMNPATGLRGGAAWTLRIFVVNEGEKPIRIQGIETVTQINGSGGGGNVTPRTREVPTQQRVLVGELTGTWQQGTDSWITQITVTANKGDSLRATLNWR